MDHIGEEQPKSSLGTSAIKVYGNASVECVTLATRLVQAL
jgi:hypothetical protein